jgi:predicted DsbA family dithiol-disulfide isomerase
MAIESDKIVAEAVESGEFPYLAQRYSVMAVPKTVINEQVAVEGAVPEIALVEEMRHAAGF